MTENGITQRRIHIGVLFALSGTAYEDYRMPFPEGKKPLMSLTAGDAAPLAFDFGFPIIKQEEDEKQLFSFSMAVPF